MILTEIKQGKKNRPLATMQLERCSYSGCPGRPPDFYSITMNRDLFMKSRIANHPSQLRPKHQRSLSPSHSSDHSTLQYQKRLVSALAAIACIINTFLMILTFPSQRQLLICRRCECTNISYFSSIYSHCFKSGNRLRQHSSRTPQHIHQYRLSPF